MWRLMQSTPRHRSWRAFAAGVLCLLWVSGARAGYLGAGAGAMVPLDGGTGYSVVGEFGGNFLSKYFQLGGEFVYSSLDRKVDLGSLGKVNLGITTYDLNAVVRFFFMPGTLSPYVGAGCGLAVIAVDDKELKARVGVPPAFLTSTSIGISGGLLGLAGLDVPLFSENFSFFVEARMGYTWEITENAATVTDPKGYRGFTGMGGFRLRY